MTRGVFLSYHDKDIGKSFALDFNSALTHAGFHVYTNNQTNPSVQQAVEEHGISIIIFSSKFDCSTWFLEEVENILECRRTIEQLVVSVFYDVDPSDVRNQKGVFGRFTQSYESTRYREVLIEAINMPRYCMSDYRNESECIDDIAQDLKKYTFDDSIWSSSSSSASEVPLWSLCRPYDVFLSYHDKDISISFALDLYLSLTLDGFHVYINNRNLTGRDQKNFSAIEGSKISVIIFSKFFDGSIWFLEEMEKILECRRTKRQIVVPVFYDVDPCDICFQKGIFGEAFEDLIAQKRWFRESNYWRARYYGVVLAKVANMSGFCMTNFRSESECINNIVEGLCSRLTEDKHWLPITDFPVGVETQVKNVIQLLNSGQPENTMIVGIWGINGVGKTTIAKATFNQMGCTFEGQSFLLNVNEIWERGDDGLVSLQQQLLSDIYKSTKIHIDTVELGKMILHERLCCKKVFLVLDDVNKLEQLNALCGSREWFGHGSRIVITTSDKHILRSLQVEHVHRMQYMGNIESLELLCWHAFRIPRPRKRYADLCRDVVEYCGGLPLALVQIGDSLFDRSVMEWKSVLEKLRTNGNHVVMEKLRTSFNYLDDDEKGLFLNIATLFMKMDKDDVIQTLNYSGHFPEVGVSVLEEKSLVNIDSKNRIGMHTLVRAMGREVISQRPIGMAETKIYDVFLSFRGEDSRAKFISHLYSSLQSSGIYLGLDDDALAFCPFNYCCTYSCV